jgi:hypothetical protein
MQFEGNTQVELHIERVVMGDKRAGVGTTGFHVKHRRLNFGEPLASKCLTETRNDCVSNLKISPCIIVYDEVGVPLPEPGVDI